jgi:ubiquinol-cytochrome c reductase cytochrome c1 subunit
MREFKILLVVVFFVGLTYIGVEPIAHSVMHKHPVATDFEFSDLESIDLSKGNAKKGKELVAQNCTACHGIKAENINAPMNSADSAVAYGVTPPDLSNMGAILSKQYLANFIKDPVNASHLAHKYKPGSGKSYPMPSYNWLGDKSISNIVSYLVSISSSNLSDKEVFINACNRCHEMKYDKILGVDQVSAYKYLGSNPPDLSVYIKSRGEEYINSFLNKPQEMLEATAMPRVGLNEKAQEKVISYLQSVGDSKKEERNSLGIYFILYFLILSVASYLWKRQVFKEVH